MSTSANSAPVSRFDRSSKRDWLALGLGAVGKSALYLLASFLLWAVAPLLFGMAVTTVASGSMEPGIRTGDAVAAMAVSPDELRPEQVILFEDPAVPERLRLHRIVSMDSEGIVTKGDANPTEDPMTVDSAAVVGVGFIRVPFIGTPLNWLHQGELLKLAGFVGTLVALGFLSQLDSGLRRRDREARRAEREDFDGQDSPSDGSGSSERGREEGDSPVGKFLRGRSRSLGAATSLVAGAMVASFVGYAAIGTSAQAAFSSQTASAASFAASTAFATPWSNATFHWGYSEVAPNLGSAIDDAGTPDNGTLAGGITRATADGNPYVTLNGTSGQIYSKQFPGAAPTNLSLETWFSTTTTRGGKLIGYGNSQTGSSTSYDRHIYMTNTGQLVFGVYNGGYQTIISPRSYNDGKFHQVTATLSTTAGSVLYVDGVAVASSATMTKAEAASNGYWRIGYDNISGWPSAPTSNYYAGSLDGTSLYPTALTASEVASHYSYGR